MRKVTNNQTGAVFYILMHDPLRHLFALGSSEKLDSVYAIVPSSYLQERSHLLTIDSTSDYDVTGRLKENT